jgi:hypothetical protein
MSSNVAKLKPKQLAVARAIAMGATDREAARENNVSTRQITRWREDPVFSGAIHDIKLEVFDAAVSRAIGLADKAISVLEDLMDGARSEFVKLSAARAVLEVVDQSLVASDIKQRIAEIEAKLKDAESSDD